MKKRLFAFFAALSAFVLTGSITCFADVIDPGPIPEVTSNPLPFIIGAVAAVIVIAIIIIAVVKKRKKQN